MTDTPYGQTKPLPDLLPYWGDNRNQHDNNNSNLRSLAINTNNGADLGTANNFWQGMSYDKLNRLSHWEDGGGVKRDFGYDRWGNLYVPAASNTGVALYATTPTDSAQFNSYNQFAAAGATYDAAGNQTKYSTYLLTYDGENRLRTAEDREFSNVTTSYVYDGLGQRVAKTSDNGEALYFVYDGFGQLAAEYTTTRGTQSACRTCFLSWDHLGTTRMVTDQAGSLITRHDYLPFGEEIPAGVGAHTNVWAGHDGVRPKFTGQPRDTETGLDFFATRYFAGVQGRFLSPDFSLADQDIYNPQSWNLYSYVRNNPLINVDPNGRSCITLTNADGDEFAGDDGDGSGCTEAGVTLGNPGDLTHPVTNHGQTNVQVIAQNPSGLEYAYTISTHQIPRYVPNDVPLNDYARNVFTEVGQTLPTVCGGGVYLYGGKELDLGGANGFAGAITEFDSREGVSKGALFEGGAGEGVVAGLGLVATTNSKGQASRSGLGYVGAGVHAVVAGGTAGTVAFSNGAGLYAKGSLFGRVVGIGVYANVTTNGACNPNAR